MIPASLFLPARCRLISEPVYLVKPPGRLSLDFLKHVVKLEELRLDILRAVAGSD